MEVPKIDVEFITNGMSLWGICHKIASKSAQTANFHSSWKVITIMLKSV